MACRQQVLWIGRLVGRLRRAAPSAAQLWKNDIRPTAVGRKRWLFIGHPDAGWRSAVAYTILVSYRRRHINPEAYLTDALVDGSQP